MPETGKLFSIPEKHKPRGGSYYGPIHRNAVVAAVEAAHAKGWRSFVRCVADDVGLNPTQVSRHFKKAEAEGRLRLERRGNVLFAEPVCS